MKSFVFGLSGLVAASTLGLLLAPACTSGVVQLANVPPLDGGDGGLDGLRGVGGRCDDGGICRPGLACNAGVCAPGRSLD